MDYIDYLKTGNKLTYWYRARQNLIKRMLDQACHRGDEARRILNVGPGTGNELELLKRFGRIEALDLNEEAVSVLLNSGWNAIQADIEQHSLEYKAFDLICAFDVLEHLENDGGALENIFRGLKTDGLFLFTVPAFQSIFSSHDRIMGHKRRYSKKDLGKKLESAGFTIEHIGYWNSLLFPLMAIFRLAKSQEAQSNDMKNYTPMIDTLLYRIINIENQWPLKNIPMPFGLTIFGIAKK